MDERMGFVIWCSNTVCEDGTELDNAGPVRWPINAALARRVELLQLSLIPPLVIQAPEFIIATLEERTGLARPDNAAQCRLDDINLFFTSGGAIVPARVVQAPHRTEMRPVDVRRLAS